MMLARLVSRQHNSSRASTSLQKTYHRAPALLSKLKGYVNDLNQFNGRNWGGLDTTSRIRLEELDVVIPGAVAPLRKPLSRARSPMRNYSTLRLK
jgi:hypothetical protein